MATVYLNGSFVGQHQGGFAASATVVRTPDELAAVVHDHRWDIVLADYKLNILDRVPKEQVGEIAIAVTRPLATYCAPSKRNGLSTEG